MSQASFASTCKQRPCVGVGGHGRAGSLLTGYSVPSLGCSTRGMIARALLETEHTNGS